MPSYAETLAALMDQRVDAAFSRISHAGTVDSRATTGTACTVIFDGTSGVAASVKCPESVLVAPGDRVGMVKFGSDWVIVYNYALRTLANTSFSASLSAGTLSSTGTYADMPGSPSFTYTKMRDATFMRYSVNVSGLSTVTGTIWRLAARIVSADGSVSYDQDVGFYRLDTTTRQQFGRWAMAASAHSAQAYTMTARWLRISGTGVLTTDTADSVEMRAEEVTS